MKMYRTILFAICLILVLSACAPGQAFGPTLTFTPTLTPVPSSTSTPAPTLTSTSTATVPPTPIFYDGNWYGTTTAGGKISFKVVGNAIESIKLSFGLTIKNGSCNITMDTTISPALSISANEFLIPAPDLKVAGIFNSATTASGTVEASAASPHCSGGINVTWTAEKE